MSELDLLPQLLVPFLVVERHENIFRHRGLKQAPINGLRHMYVCLSYVEVDEVGTLYRQLCCMILMAFAAIAR